MPAAQGSNRPSETDTDDVSIEDRFEVHHNGGNRFTVHDTQAGGTYRVDLDYNENTDIDPVTPLFGNDDVPEGNARFIVEACVRAGPEYREGPQEHLSVTVEAPSGGGNASTSAPSSDDSDESRISPSDVVTDPPSDHDYDADELVTNVNAWLSNYASVKSGMIDGAWDAEFATITRPNGDSELGVVIDDDPWHGPHWDHDANTFDTDDGKQPDEWSDHKAALKEIYQSENDPVKGFSVERDDSEYDDWFNYIPADDAAELGA